MTPAETNTVDVYAVGVMGDLYKTLGNNTNDFSVRPVIVIEKDFVRK